MLKMQKKNGKALSEWIITVISDPLGEPYEKRTGTHNFQEVEKQARQLIEKLKKAKDLTEVFVTAYRYEHRELYQLLRKTPKVLKASDRKHTKKKN